MYSKISLYKIRNFSFRLNNFTFYVKTESNFFLDLYFIIFIVNLKREGGQVIKKIVEIVVENTQGGSELLKSFLLKPNLT